MYLYLRFYLWLFFCITFSYLGEGWYIFTLHIFIAMIFPDPGAGYLNMYIYFQIRVWDGIYLHYIYFSTLCFHIRLWDGILHYVYLFTFCIFSDPVVGWQRFGTWMFIYLHYIFRPGCGMAEVWDLEDPDNKGKDPVCSRLQKTPEPYFKQVFKTQGYVVMQVLKNPVIKTS